MGKIRGDTELAANLDTNNFILLFGCKGGLGVKADTKMVHDISKAFMDGLDRITLTTILPGCLDGITGTDANFEMVVSNNGLPIVLFYRHNVVVKSQAVIFYTPELTRGIAEVVSDKTMLNGYSWRELRQD